MIGLLLLACCVGPSRAGAQTQPTATTATTVAAVASTAPAGANDAEVEGLIRQLAADEWRTRAPVFYAFTRLIPGAWPTN